VEHLFAPWRQRYIVQAVKTAEEGCIFCDKPQDDDQAALIILRGKYNFIILNTFPYNAGHLMVAPLRHLANFEGLTEQELMEHYKLVQKACSVLTQVYHPDGYNIGMNLGRTAGAGFDKHLHTHIVPRWAGDTNYMPILADTTVVNEALEDTYKELKPLFE
jgi:ATP adenylyltransferase